MFISEIISIIDGIGRVKNLVLNEQEKKIVKELVINFDESNLFDPANQIKYALINNKSNLDKRHYYQKYLEKHASIISNALTNTQDNDLIEKLSGLRTVNKEFQKLDEEFELTDKEINEYLGKEVPRLRDAIDRYRWVMSMCILSLVNSMAVNIPAVKTENFKTLVSMLNLRFQH